MCIIRVRVSFKFLSWIQEDPLFGTSHYQSLLWKSLFGPKSLLTFLNLHSIILRSQYSKVGKLASPSCPHGREREAKQDQQWLWLMSALHFPAIQWNQVFDLRHCMMWTKTATESWDQGLITGTCCYNIKGTEDWEGGHFRSCMRQAPLLFFIFFTMARWAHNNRVGMEITNLQPYSPTTPASASTMGTENW